MSDKIKTSEEVREELADKKVAKTYLAEFENGINHKLSRFEDVLANFKPTCEIKHKYDTDEIKRLNTALNEIVLKLQEISIPEKIEVLEKKENKINTRNNRYHKKRYRDYSVRLKETTNPHQYLCDERKGDLQL